MSSKRQNNRISFLIYALYALAFLIFILILSKCADNTGDDIADKPYTGNNQSATAYRGSAVSNNNTDKRPAFTGENVLAYDENMDESYMDSCIFLGDSRIVGMVMCGYIRSNSALAQIGLSHTNAESVTYRTTDGDTYSFKSYLESHQAAIVYICYGVNGIKAASKEDFKEKYIKLVDDVMAYEPTSVIVLQSVWPVKDDGPYKDSVSTKDVEEFNEFLYELAVERDLYYLDTESILCDENGEMLDKYNSGDGLHYNKAANEAILQYIIHHPVPDICLKKNNFPYEDFIWDTRPKTQSGGSVSDNDILSIYDTSVSDNSASENSAGYTDNVSDNSVNPYDNQLNESEQNHDTDASDNDKLIENIEIIEDNKSQDYDTDNRESPNEPTITEQ